MTAAVQDLAVRLQSQAAAGFGRVLEQVGAGQWELPTPCPAWDVRALVDHVTAVRSAGPEANPDPRRLSAEYLVHTWDLAVAIGAPDVLDPDLVAAVTDWFGPHADRYRNDGLVGPAAPIAADAGPQDVLLAAFGRDRRLSHTRAAVARFAAAFDRRDLDAVMAAMTADCVFESTQPPDGVRHEGTAAVRAAWAELFASSPGARFETEEQFAGADRMVVRWTYRWGDGHVRGVDVFRVRDGRVAEKLAYVKG